MSRTRNAFYHGKEDGKRLQHGLSCLHWPASFTRESIRNAYERGLRAAEGHTRGRRESA